MFGNGSTPDLPRVGCAGKEPRSESLRVALKALERYLPATLTLDLRDGIDDLYADCDEPRTDEAKTDEAETQLELQAFLAASAKNLRRLEERRVQEVAQLCKKMAAGLDTLHALIRGLDPTDTTGRRVAE